MKLKEVIKKLKIEVIYYYSTKGNKETRIYFFEGNNSFYIIIDYIKIEGVKNQEAFIKKWIDENKEKELIEFEFRCLKIDEEKKKKLKINSRNVYLSKKTIRRYRGIEKTIYIDEE